MATIHKLTKDGATIFPATITDAIVHPNTGKTLTSMIKDYNVSELFPTEGVDGGNKYNLALAIQVLNTHLTAAEKTGGVKLTFISTTSPYPEEEYYLQKSTWSTTPADWGQRFEVGGVIANPSGSWTPGTAEAYIDQQVAVLTSEVVGESIARQQLGTSLQTQINSEIYNRTAIDNRQDTELDQLRDLYEGLTESDVIVGPRPSSGQLTNTIYREPDQEHTPPQFYCDYMWYNSAWVLMAQYDNGIDDNPLPNSNNLVKSSGVFNNMGAFDVSAYNSGAYYQSLTAALNAVPLTMRAGGMSIKYIHETPAQYSVVKTEGLETQPTGTALSTDPNIVSGTYTAAQLSGFSALPTTLNASLTYYLEVSTGNYTSWVITYVQSSDNKYVQYRYMSTSTAVADFTNEANWQGVDDEPTAGSDNLVKSGGVKQNELNNNNIVCYKGYLDSLGRYIEDAANGNVSPFITIPRGETQIVCAETKSQYGTFPSVCIYDGYGNWLENHYVDGTSEQSPVASGITTIIIEQLPANAVYFRVRYKSTVSSIVSLFGDTPYKRLSVIYPEQFVKEMSFEDAGGNKTIVNGGFYNGYYQYVEYSSFNSIHTEKISCNPGDKFLYKGQGVDPCKSVICFNGDTADKNKTLVINSPLGFTEFIVPQGIDGVIFQSYVSSPATPELTVAVKGDKPLDMAVFDMDKKVLKSEADINTMSEDVDELKEKVEAINIGNRKYIRLAYKDFLNTMNDWLTLGTWTQSPSNGMFPSSVGDAISHKSQYLCDDRVAQFTVSLRSNTIMRIDTKRSADLTSQILDVLGDGGSCFEIDMQNKRIAMYGMGADSASDTPSDSAWRTAYLTNVIVSQASIPDSMVPASADRVKFLVSVYRRNLKHILVLTNLNSGEEISCEHTGWAVGRQLGYYTLQWTGGLKPILIKFCVYAPNHPDLVVFGDSIQEGIGCLDRTKIWKNLAAADFPDYNILLSAISGGNKVHLERAITSEYSIYKPKNLVITIGVNDVSDENYNETTWVASMKALISQLNSMGINVIWNCASLAAQPQTEAKIEHERRIRSLNTVILSEPGEHMRFDMALAIDFDIANPADIQLLYDTGHPNIAGQAMFYRRALCDSVVLTSTRYD